jgi:hypothetical protein
MCAKLVLQADGVRIIASDGVGDWTCLESDGLVDLAV